MMEDITVNDIESFEKILNVKGDYTQMELFQNFKKYSYYAHPSLYRTDTNKFEKYILSYDVLSFIIKGKRKNKLEDLISDWNFSRKNIVMKSIENYKGLTPKQYKESLNFDSSGFIVIKIFFNIIILIVMFILCGVFISEVIQGKVSAFGIFLLSIILLGLIIRLYRKGGARMLGDFRYFKD
jgi:hypothetical protein